MPCLLLVSHGLSLNCLRLFWVCKKFDSTMQKTLLGPRSLFACLLAFSLVLFLLGIFIFGEFFCMLTSWFSCTKDFPAWIPECCNTRFYFILKKKLAKLLVFYLVPMFNWNLLSLHVWPSSHTQACMHVRFQRGISCHDLWIYQADPEPHVRF